MIDKELMKKAKLAIKQAGPMDLVRGLGRGVRNFFSRPTAVLPQAIPAARSAVSQLPSAIPAAARSAPLALPANLPIANLSPTRLPTAIPVARSSGLLNLSSVSALPQATPVARNTPSYLDALSRSTIDNSLSSGIGRPQAIAQARQFAQQLGRNTPVSAPTPSLTPSEPTMTFYRGINQPFQRFTPELQRRETELAQLAEQHMSQYGSSGLTRQPWYNEFNRLGYANRPQFFAGSPQEAARHGQHVYELTIPRSHLNHFDLAGVAGRGMEGAATTAPGISPDALNKLLDMRNVSWRLLGR